MALSNTVFFNINRQEPELIVPDKPTPSEIKPLSDIDDQNGVRFLVPALFFYSKILSDDDPVEIIRRGLAKTLVYYYPFAGRIFEGANRKLMVNCNSQGVLFIEADANVKLEQLGDGIFPPCPYMDNFLCVAPHSDSGGVIASPLLFFQVTRFICGGFSLGIRLNHTMADGYGLMLFLQTLGELIKGHSTPSTLPVWQREFLLIARNPPRVTRRHLEYDDLTLETRSEAIREDKFVRTSVLFGPKEIINLRNQAKNRQCSKFELIVACLWKCRTIALEIDCNDIVRFSGLNNIRSEKFGMGFPVGYYGNAFIYPAAASKAGTLVNSPLSYALDLVKHAKNQLDEEYVRSTVDLMVIKGRPKYGTPLNFLVSDIRSLGFDKLDLGWGKPLYGGVPWATTDISFVSHLKNNEGEDKIVASICLPPLALEKFKYELRKMTFMGPISKI